MKNGLFRLLKLFSPFISPILSALFLNSSFLPHHMEYYIFSSFSAYSTPLSHDFALHFPLLLFPPLLSSLSPILHSQEPALERVNLPGTVGFFRKKKTDNPSTNGAMNMLDSSSHDDSSEQAAMCSVECSVVGEEKDLPVEDSPRNLSLSGQDDKVDDDDGGFGGSDGGDVGDGDSDDGVGWITPENLMQACEEMGGVQEETAHNLPVACVTTDFAMQVYVQSYTLYAGTCIQCVYSHMMSCNTK